MNKVIKLWDDLNATLETYVLKSNEPKGVVLICPGGGYHHVSPREGAPIARKFNEHGYHAFVLTYSVAPLQHPQPLLDVAKAMSEIRKNAYVWNIDPEKIAVCGFSAGGHLAGSLAVFADTLNYPNLDSSLIKPNALILAYPVITSGEASHKGSFLNLLGDYPNGSLLEEMSLEKQVHKNMPPTFIWHTLNDDVVPVDNTLLFVSALRKQNIPFELHIYPKGPHGISLATKETASNELHVNPHVASWMNLCLEWLDTIFLK